MCSRVGRRGTFASSHFRAKDSLLRISHASRRSAVFQCQNASSDLGKFVAASSVDDILASHYDLPNCDASLPHCLAATNAVINVQSDRDQRAVLTLAPDVPPAARRDDIRAALSINSCTGCHGAETNTEFHQIRQRAQKSPKPALWVPHWLTRLQANRSDIAYFILHRSARGIAPNRL